MLTNALQTGYLSESEMLQGRGLLSAFIEEEKTTNPYDRLVALSEDLEKKALLLEGEATQKVANLLQGLIDDQRIPAALKVAPQGALRTNGNTIIIGSQLRSRQVMQDTHDETSKKVGKLVRKCDELKRDFETLLRRTDIPKMLFSNKHQELLSAYIDADTRQVPYDALLTLAQGLASEGRGILRRFILYTQHRTASMTLQSQLDNAYIPEEFKSNARIVVTQPFTATDEAAASEIIRSFESTIEEIKQRVRDTEAACDKKKRKLQTSLGDTNIHPYLKTNGQRLLDGYIAAGICGSNLDTLVQLARGLDAECIAISTNHQLRNTYIDRKYSLLRVINNNAIDRSLKYDGHQLVGDFINIELSKTSTMAELLAKADEIDVERKKIIARHAVRQQFLELFESIDTMKRYGERLSNKHPNKSDTVRDLSQELKERIDEFVMSQGTERPKDIQEFKSGFKLLLHSQDGLMHSHRHIWKPIVANILLALTGIGLVAIIIKATSQAIQPQGNPLDPNRTFNHSLFFAKTKTQAQLELIEDKFNASLVLP